MSLWCPRTCCTRLPVCPGSQLVSGGDGGELFMWQHDPNSPDKPWQRQHVCRCGPWAQQGGNSCILGKQHTSPRGTGWDHHEPSTGCRGHAEDVYDVTWAPDSTCFASGSVENLCIVWDAATGRGKLRLEQHTHYVQGVAWDPLGPLLLTLSSDRTCRYASALPSVCAGQQQVGPHLLSPYDDILQRRWRAAGCGAAGRA